MLNFLNGEGRASRLQYLAVQFGGGFFMLIVMLLTAPDQPTAPDEQPTMSGDSIAVLLTLSLLFTVVSWSATIRRLHDRGITGWMSLIQLVPVAGIILFLYLAIAPGHERSNKYGPPPGGGPKISKEEHLARVEALKQQAETAQKQRDEQYLTEDGSYDLGAMFR